MWELSQVCLSYEMKTKDVAYNPYIAVIFHTDVYLLLLQLDKSRDVFCCEVII